MSDKDSDRCHCSRYEVGEFAHVPFDEAVKVFPTIAVPEIVGTDRFLGAGIGTNEVALVSTAVEPPALFAVTITFRYVPASGSLTT